MLERWNPEKVLYQHILSSQGLCSQLISPMREMPDREQCTQVKVTIGMVSKVTTGMVSKGSTGMVSKAARAFLLLHQSFCTSLLSSSYS